MLAIFKISSREETETREGRECERVNERSSEGSRDRKRPNSVMRDGELQMFAVMYLMIEGKCGESREYGVFLCQEAILFNYKIETLLCRD